MHRHLITLLLTSSATIAVADDLTEKAGESIEKTKNRIPALELLPAGSILKKISIPRYNKDYTPASLLTAEQFEVISDEEIQGTNVGISLYDDKGKIKTRSMLNSVNFNQTTGLLTSKENLTFSGDTFTTSSQGVTLDWENHCGFLLGKNQTIIYLKESTSMKKTNQQPNKIPRTKSSKPNSLATAAALVIASPTFLTAQELAEVDEAAKPSTELFIQQLDETKKILTATAEAEAKIAAIRKELTTKLGKIPAVDPAQPAPPELIPVKGREFINITSDRLLFDAKKGIFVYYGNVRITHPRYSFTCAGELKIILNESATAKKLKPEERAKLKPKERFDTGSIKQIIATKNVIFRGKDDKGKDVTGVTENLIAQNIIIKKVNGVNIIKGDIFLKGKDSRITTAEGQLKVITKNGYIKLDHNFNASGQGIDTSFVVPDNAKKPKDKKKAP